MNAALKFIMNGRLFSFAYFATDIIVSGLTVKKNP